MIPQLKGAFLVLESLIWMDSSTTKKCREIENVVGGVIKVLSTRLKMELPFYFVITFYLQPELFGHSMVRR
jgi:hypothetical protein